MKFLFSIERTHANEESNCFTGLLGPEKEKNSGCHKRLCLFTSPTRNAVKAVPTRTSRIRLYLAASTKDEGPLMVGFWPNDRT